MIFSGLSACGGGADSDPSGQDAAPAAVEGSAITMSHADRVRKSQSMEAASAQATNIVVKARGAIAGDVGPIMQLRINGTVVGSAEVRASDYTDYSFTATGLEAGAQVDIVYTNDGKVNGVDRNLFVTYISDGTSSMASDSQGVIYDRGVGAAAFDGQNTIPGQSAMYWGGALHMSWPSTAGSTADAQYAAARFLMAATFGATQTDIDTLQTKSFSAWIDEQRAMPVNPDFVDYVQSKFNLGAAYLPGGSKYDTNWLSQKFWALAATAPDQLRRRVGYALQQIFVVSMQDAELHAHMRPYANYLDNLNKYAFGNYRDLLEEVALSPVMGIYLSHIRNEKEDPSTNREPDENFAREVMQLFSIGLYELNNDGTLKLDANGQPIPTYNNNDVMAMAKVFTGWSWGLPDNQLTEWNFHWAGPDYSTTGSSRIDLQRMKAYPGMHSTAQKSLFSGKPWAVTLPSNADGPADLKSALDTLFCHPNIGPFVSRQLIQRLVTSAPSPAYVGRVASVFNNNGAGVRGDLGAVVRAILLDSEARTVQPLTFGRLREPVLRTTQWMRAFAARSTSGEFLLGAAMNNLSQRPLYQPSVFNFYRPGYVPPNTDFAARNAPAPEFQITNESTTAAWVNTAQGMAVNGIGWTGSTFDVKTTYSAQQSLLGTAGPTALLDNLNLLLFAGTMSSQLRSDITDSILGIRSGSSPNYALNQIRLAVFLAMVSPEFLAQH